MQERKQRDISLLRSKFSEDCTVCECGLKDPSRQHACKSDNTLAAPVDESRTGGRAKTAESKSFTIKQRADDASVGDATAAQSRLERQRRNDDRAATKTGNRREKKTENA